MIYSYIGLQGSGKTTHATAMAIKYLNQGIKVYSNVDIYGTIKYDVNDLGNKNIFNGVLIFDEAGIDINSRQFANKGSLVNTKSFIEFWKKIRHDGIIDCYVYSQAWDYDATVRRLCSAIYIIKNWLFNYSLIYKCLPEWGFNAEGQPIIKWTIRKFPLFFNRLPYYKYFDSYEHNFRKPIMVEYFNNIMKINNKYIVIYKIKYYIKRVIFRIKNIHFPKLKINFPKLRLKS